MLTSPLLTRYFFATSKIVTSNNVMPRKMPTAAINVDIIADCSNNIISVFTYQILIPRKLINAIPINPVSINVIPIPRNGRGMLE